MGLDTVCTCLACGREERVSFIACLFGKGPHRGWPYCCGRQMRMGETTCDIDGEMGAALAPVKAQIAAARRGELS